MLLTASEEVETLSDTEEKGWEEDGCHWTALSGLLSGTGEENQEGGELIGHSL